MAAAAAALQYQNAQQWAALSLKSGSQTEKRKNIYIENPPAVNLESLFPWLDPSNEIQKENYKIILCF